MTSVGSDEKPEGNRRAFARSPIIVREARCISGMGVFFGYAVNVSRGGMFISASAPRQRAPIDDFEIQFSLPGVDHLFACRARVAWIRNFKRGSFETPGFGIEFLDLPEKDTELIGAWVDGLTLPA